MGYVEQALEESIRLRQELLAASVGAIEEAADLAVSVLQAGHRIYFAGNGGSAADAQHLAAELVGRFRKDRAALPAIALTTDSSVLTAVGNDYAFSEIFSRQAEALIEKGDLLIALSTSGSSENLLAALRVARKKGARSIGLTGASGGRMKELADTCLCVPSQDTARIQECHITIGHILCERIEEALFGGKG